MRLADAIAQVRAELSRARKEAEGQDIRFAVGEITVELSLEFTQSIEGGGGVKVLSLFDLSGKAGAVDKAVNKLTLKMTAHEDGDPDRNLDISDLTGPRSKPAGKPARTSRRTAKE